MPGLHAGPRPCVVIAAARAPWEPSALGLLADADMVVLRRCVDLPDLLAVVAAGEADVAVLAATLPGLDADAVRRLAARQVRPVAVLAEEDRAGALRERLERLGVTVVDDAERLPAAIESLLAAPRPEPARAVVSASGAHGTVVAVWGPTGAPGRTTVATGLAAAAGADGSATVLVDADPWGPAVAQQLGLLEETSGLLAAARLVAAGGLDDSGLTGCLRGVSPGLEVLTGLPRPDRWIEVRPGVLAELLDTARGRGDVVVDCGFSVDRDGAGALDRAALTVEVLETADTVVVVGSAEPTGLARLARALVELGDVVPGVRPVVVVNRMRDSLGWRPRDVRAMVEGYARVADVCFLPLDVAAADRGARAGRSVVEAGDGPLGRALRELAAMVTALAGQAPNSR